jgi:hypothetical protein
MRSAISYQRTSKSAQLDALMPRATLVLGHAGAGLCSDSKLKACCAAPRRAALGCVARAALHCVALRRAATWARCVAQGARVPFGHGLAFWDGLAHGRRRWIVIARDELRAHFAAEKDEGEGEARPGGRRALLRRRCAQWVRRVPVQMWRG